MDAKQRALLAGGTVVVLLAGGLGFALTRGGDDEPAPTTTTAAAPTTTVPGRVWPLTGLPAGADDRIDRPAIAVKVSNSSAARPQVGLDVADVVIEERVEGITRFIAVFQSTTSSPVGPIRSARDSDIDLLAALGRPVFVWGGANEGVAARVASANVVSFNVDPDAAEDKYRDDQRPAPDNLFIDSTDAFWAKAGGASAPHVFFPIDNGEPPPAPVTSTPPDLVPPSDDTTPPPSTGLPGTPTPGVSVDYNGTTADFLWDADRGGWVRIQDGTPHTVASGEVLAPTNVVLLTTSYLNAPSDPSSPVAVTVGQGDATVLVGGNVVDASWIRLTPDDPFVITDDATGRVVVLPPGRTWIGLPPGVPTRLDQATATQLASQIPAVG